MMEHRIEQADALDFLRSLPDSSVALILTDPPYFKVKPHGWDRQWSRRDGFLDWLDCIAEEWARVLKPNGTIVCFAGGNPTAGATTAARVEVLLGERFNVVSSAVWVKADAQGNGKFSVQHKPGLRGHFPQAERAIICEHFGADSFAKGEAGYERKCDELRGFVFEPLRAYLDDARIAAGLTTNEIARAWMAAHGKVSKWTTRLPGHWFESTQWMLPTAANYEWLRALFNGEHLRREYEDLRREYEDLRREYEDLRRPFDAEAGTVG